MADKIYAYSSSPHVKNPITTKRIMIDVCIALAPACIMGIVFFGYMAAILLAVSVLSAVAFEFIYLLIAGKNIKEIIAQFDYTSCVTGLLFAMSIGVQSPVYVPILGNAFAIIVVKMLFGGTGKNLVNPAVTGRIFAFISFTAVMASGWVEPAIGAINGGRSVVSGATVLVNTLEGKPTGGLSNLDLFLGTGLAGCIGETCKIALLIGGVYLVVRKVISPTVPLIYIAVTGLFTVCLNEFDFATFLPSILSGGLILGAVFMATDYTTSPNTFVGNIVYAVMLGLITAGLRMSSGKEVVSFAILIMNLIVPLIDKFIIPKPFGYQKPKKGGAN